MFSLAKSCKAYGFQYAGIEYAQECYCDNSISNGGSLVSDGCDMPCLGNSSEYCGGSDRLNVYQLPSTVSSSSKIVPSG